MNPVGAPAGRSLAALGLVALGCALATLAARIAVDPPQALRALLPQPLQTATSVDLDASADVKAQSIAAALRRWVRDAERLAADPRWDGLGRVPTPGDAMIDALAADPVASRQANVLFIDAAGRVRASLYPSRRTGQRLGGNADALARVVASARGSRRPAQSLPVTEESRAAVLTAAPTAAGNVLVLVAGPAQFAELLRADDATVDLLLVVEGQWHRLAGDERSGFRLLRAAADAERDALLDRALAGSAGVVRRAGVDGGLIEQTARNLPGVGALMLMSRSLPAERPGARIAAALSRWALPGGLVAAAVAAFIAAVRLRRGPRTTAGPRNPVARVEPRLGAAAEPAGARPPDGPAPGGSDQDPPGLPEPGHTDAPLPAEDAATATDTRAGAGVRPGAAQASTPEPADGRPDPTRTPPGLCRLTEVLSAVAAGWTGAGGELVLRRGPGVTDQIAADGAVLAALLGQLVALVGNGRPGMAVSIAVERARAHPGLAICVGAPRDGQLPAAAEATLDAIADPPAGWDAAAMTVLDAAARCAVALGARLRSSADGRVLAVDAPFGSLPEAEPAPARAPFRGRRCVLIADDEPTAAVVGEMLVRLGFDVHEREDLRTGLEEARRASRSGARACDLIVLDDRVPDAIELEAHLGGPEATCPPVVLLQGRHAPPPAAAVTLALARPLDAPQLAGALAGLPGLVANPGRPAGPIDAKADPARPAPPAASPRALDRTAGRARDGTAPLDQQRLAAFAREHRGDARQFAALLAAGRHVEARERLRKLDAAARSLALPALTRVTAAIDEALRNGRPVPPSRLHELGAALTAAVAAAEDAAAETAPAPPDVATAPVTDPAARAELWQRFDAALARGDIGALDLYERLARGHDGAAWRALRDALLVLDYARAAEIRTRVR